MGTIKIYIKLINNKLEYRDTEFHHGKNIETEVNPGDKIIWKLDQCSGIKEISDIAIAGDKSFFSKGPKMKDFDSWKAVVADTAKGEISYSVSGVSCYDKATFAVKSVKSGQAEILKDEEPPKLILK